VVAEEGSASGEVRIVDNPCGGVTVGGPITGWKTPDGFQFDTFGFLPIVNGTARGTFTFPGTVDTIVLTRK